MKKQKFEGGFPSEVVEDFGQLSQCLECEYAYEETALINNERYCQECVSIKFPNETAKFEKTDAKLSCPVTDNKCGAKNLSCDQFMVGTCCEDAAFWKNEGGNYQNYVSLNKIHDQSTDAEHDAEIKCESAKMKIETCRQNLEEAKKALELAEKESNDAQIELNEKKKWRRTETLMMGTRLFFLFCVLLWYVLQLMKPYVRFTSTYYMDESESRIKCDSAKMKVETCRQKLEEVKKALELAEKESNDAKIELNEKKKWRRTVQKRTLYLATIVMKEDDSDLENEPDQNGDAGNQTDLVSETCKVETENSAKENRQKA